MSKKYILNGKEVKWKEFNEAWEWKERIFNSVGNIKRERWDEMDKELMHKAQALLFIVQEEK
jgi:hypothetical protein